MPFDPRPVNWVKSPEISEAIEIHRGYTGLARLIGDIRREKAAPVRVRCDGMWGVAWEEVAATLLRLLKEAGWRAQAYFTTAALRPEDELRTHFAPWLTDNPVFGRVAERPITDYFQPETYSELVAAFMRDGSHDVAFLFGPYAVSPMTRSTDLTLYIDLPREDVVAFHRQGGLNLGFETPAPAETKYKIAYYVEWPLLERHKKQVLPEVDYYISAHGGEFKWVSRKDLYEMVQDVSSRPFRCKPYFMPGVWGGQRIKQVAGLPSSWVNCAWDFEIVAPENAVTLGASGETFTVPFHIFMWLNGPKIVGPLATQYFGDYFPIRFNYLDTMDGTNLSLQVHPHSGYIHERFNEPIAQDETYYIVENKPGAKVYLGLKEHVTRDAFCHVAIRAQQEQVPFDIEEYVAAWDSKVGDLYLIPAGTVHCSGKDNLVLEISSTPYWYTFKIYDYLRPDLTGKPRPINLEYAFDVIDFSRKTEWVRRHLIQTPRLVRKEPGGREVHLGSTPFTFYGVNRLEIETEMRDATAGSFHIVTAVRGEGVDIVSEEGLLCLSLAYLETAVIPEAFGAYRLVAKDGPAHVIKAFIKQ